MYFSEHLFWARVRPDDSIRGWIMTWIAYSLSGFVFLFIVKYFHVNSFWMVFLAGSIFGWLTEGVIVQTTYEDLPLSISFTGLAWHALISVCVGWYAFRDALSKSAVSTMMLSSLIGLCYGLWAISWWLEPDGGKSSIFEFAGFSFVITLIVMLAYWVNLKFDPYSFAPPRWMLIIVVIGFVILFLISVIPAVGIRAFILPVLLVLVIYALYRSKQKSRTTVQFQSPQKQIPNVRLISLLVIPGVAVVLYTIAYILDLKWQTNWILYFLTTPSGFILLAIGIIKAVRKTHELSTEA